MRFDPSNAREYAKKTILRPLFCSALMKRTKAAVALSVLAVVAGRSATDVIADTDGLVVPNGFSVSIYAGDEMAHDIFSMTVDAQGRVVVAGPGYIKILHDDDRDGRVERSTLFSAAPKSGAHGMYFDGSDLICTGDDAVRRLTDRDNDGLADDEGQVITRLHNPEHGANGVLRGPDGWYYVICGNDAGASAEHATRPGSPVEEPKCGAIVRISPDGREMDVLAHGFRNPYDADFSAMGNLLLVDADGERDHALPWYAPTRLFDVAAGMEHGWLQKGWQRSWNRPQSYFDNVERAAEIGRGSPTGALVYRHRQFPERYRHGIFSACWTFGRVYFLPLEGSGASYTGRVETFLKTTGETGFAPVDLAVGPEGDLFVAIGGRGTRGSVFRVCYNEQSFATAAPDSGLDAVLDADQPLTSWSRARWVPVARKLGPEAFAAVLVSMDENELRQVRAVEVLTELFGGVSLDLARKAITLARPALSARLAWAISRHDSGVEARNLLAELTYYPDPRVQRAAWESLAAVPKWRLSGAAKAPDWRGASKAANRRVRAAMLLAARRAGYESVDALFGPPIPDEHPRMQLARQWLARLDRQNPAATVSYFRTCLDVLARCDEAATKLEAIRLLQIGLGDLRVQADPPEVYIGYAGNDTWHVDVSVRRETASQVAAIFPTNNLDVDREAARLLAMLAEESPGATVGITSQITSRSLPEDDIHFLIVLSRLPGLRTPDETARVAKALVGLHPKLEVNRSSPDRNWPVRVGEMAESLYVADPALAEAILAEEAFGRPEHSLFVTAMSGSLREIGARRLLARVDAQGKDVPWTPELVTALAVLPDEEILPRLRERWDDYALREPVVRRLALTPHVEDRGRLIEALSSPQPNVIAAAAKALCIFSSPADATEIAAALAALRQCGDGREERQVRSELSSLLTHWTGERPMAASDEAALYRAWLGWFTQTYPEAAARLAGLTSVDGQAWKNRLASVNWSNCDSQRGQQLFEKLACHRCHRGAGKLGPDLAGAAARFSLEDLFVEIVEPSRNVAPLYRTSTVTTRSGHIYRGLLVYHSSDGLLLQTDPDTTIRVAGADVASVQPGNLSLMPAGLLDRTSDAELADLYAYLRGLAK
jgi:putative membrane-bound dehydrogenase-like protein